jgi:hypothetical protein
MVAERIQAEDPVAGSDDILGKTKTWFSGNNDRDPLSDTKVFKQKSHAVLFGPDGMPLGADAVVEENQEGELKVKLSGHKKVEIHDQGWFHAESNRYEQEELASSHLRAITQAAIDRQAAGLCADGRWANDPNVFPSLGLSGSITANPLIPFPPNDQQYFIKGMYNMQMSSLRPSAVPACAHHGAESSTWVRLVDFGQHADAVHLFDEFSGKSHCGRVIQGALDNGYFVEALQAISMRPKLVRQLFYCWNPRRSIYIARIFKHGTWMRVEVDDYFPVGKPVNGSDPNVPICSRSEYFPNVIWPSMIEKAYAKVHTIRGSPSAVTPEDRGGWEALSGGGRVEEALADLTGGIAGRFRTCDVSADRLFVYIFELQRDTLFVCRVNEANCAAQGIRLNPYYPNVVNRAVHWEGGLYIQVFCGAPGVFDGGLQDITVPYSLLHCEDYPESSADGFFWITAIDFHEYFDTIFECRLVNSGDVSIPNMPPPRFSPFTFTPGDFKAENITQMAAPDMPLITPPNVTAAAGAVPDWSNAGVAKHGAQHKAPDGSPLPWFEWVFANPGEVARINEPEFTISVPEGNCPCEIVCSVEQVDPRMNQTSPLRKSPVPILVKVYENVEGLLYYSKELVCRSNWLPVRDAMVAFTATRGGQYKIVAEFPDGKSKVARMIFRCYSSRPNITVAAATMSMRRFLVEPLEGPKAHCLSFVGSMQPEDDHDTNRPVDLDLEMDAMRKPEWDINPNWAGLVDDVQKECAMM